MPSDLRYALLTDLSTKRPWGFSTLAELARRVHRDRAGDALQLRPAVIEFRDGPRDVAEVLAEDAGGRVRRIGFAWLNGAHWRTLEAALAAETSPASWGLQ